MQETAGDQAEGTKLSAWAFVLPVVVLAVGGFWALAEPRHVPVMAWAALGLALAAGALGLLNPAGAMRRTLAVYAGILLVAALALGWLCRSGCGRSWFIGIDGDLRRAWRGRVQPAALRARLRVGMSPGQVLSAMGLHDDAAARARAVLIRGRTLRETFDAMGVDPTLPRPQGASGDVEFFVWCHPICPTLGCCDGVLLLEFRSRRLARVVVHNLFDNQARLVSDDLARYEPGGPGAGNRRFSPRKTLDAVLASEAPGLDVFAPAIPAGGQPQGKPTSP